MTIRAMTIEDLERVIGWAADEGWNPGLDDAAAFFAADPAGFIVKEVNGAPVAAISVVNHDADFAFLGLYLCTPAFRGQGHGMAVWRAGVAHAAGRCIGLDGVPDQQANYARSGFVKHGGTVRFEGRLDAVPDPRVRPVLPSELPLLVDQDARITGISRRAFASAWYAPTPTRQTFVLSDGERITGFATFRRCQSGTKVGPLCASSEADALALLAASPFDAPMFVDVQGHDTALAKVLQQRGFVPTFETARMFTAAPPKSDPPKFHAIATMELG